MQISHSVSDPAQELCASCSGLHKLSRISLTPTGRYERYLTEIWLICDVYLVVAQVVWWRILLFLLMVSSIPKPVVVVPSIRGT